jgi:hypothetical protein
MGNFLQAIEHHVDKYAKLGDLNVCAFLYINTLRLDL